MRSCISLYDLFYKENEHHKITSLSGAPLAAYLRGVLYYFSPAYFLCRTKYYTKRAAQKGDPESGERNEVSDRVTPYPEPSPK